ncbi:MAG: secondary thiamine-phosphate synthase enzyme YjbQ [Methylacidiphilales bacterium]|nr:secondary thiamine-phosphate synthase enzyme YjbQ [Candidatus Methylacidiphilales bacterium]MDW8349903.1 secondary thiamine-phosphate synthase enzyme YjbQ [Verrucomicrobiae bacterium]
MAWVHYAEMIEVATQGRGTYEITDTVRRHCAASKVREGQCVIFVQHTSASLVIYENADPTARCDLHAFMDQLVPDRGHYQHDLEGPDDATSHLKMALTRTSEAIPIVNQRLALGTWQGIFLFEHRDTPHRRRLVISILGIA